MSKSNKARKYESPILKELLDEITPIEMEQTKVKMQLAAHIEDLMKARGWGKSQFAEKVGKNPSEITKWLSGTQNLTVDVLTEIAFALGVDVQTLFGKKQTPVIYRTVIVVNSVVKQQPLTISTPFSEHHDSLHGSFYGRNSSTNIPVTPLYQA